MCDDCGHPKLVEDWNREWSADRERVRFRSRDPAEFPGERAPLSRAKATKGRPTLSRATALLAFR